MGRQHSITDDEIRAIIAFPLLRYGITTAYPEADTYMFGGRVKDEPWIEVAAEDDNGDTWHVFHAMILTRRVAREVYKITGGTVDLRNEIAPQRPFIPRLGEEL